MLGTDRIVQLAYRSVGWCPNSHSMKAETKIRTGTEIGSRPATEQEPPGGNARLFRRPDLFVAVAIAILFATIFVGGNSWWPVFVGAVAFAMIGYTAIAARGAHA